MTTQIDQNPPAGLEPRIENGKALLIAGLRERPETIASVPDQWQRAMAYKIPNRVGRVGYGVNFNCMSRTGSFEYLAGVEVSDFSGLPAELSQVSIPAQKYLVFTHREHVSTLWQTCDSIGKWLPHSGYEHTDPVAGAPDFFERYGEDFNPQTGTGGMEVWVPIKP
jgi:AraC family transcriptional regulator